MFSVRLVTPLVLSRSLSFVSVASTLSHSPKPNLTHIVLFLFIINIIVAPPGCCHRTRPSWLALFTFSADVFQSYPLTTSQ